MARAQTSAKPTSRLVQIAAAIIIIFAVRYTKEVLIPIALAVLFTFLLAPLATRLEKLRVGRVPAVLIVVLLAFSVIGLLGYIVAKQVKDLGEKIPSYAATIEQRVKWLQNFTNGSLSKLKGEAETIAKHVSTSQPATTPGAGSLSAMFGRDEIQKVQVVPNSPPITTMLLETLGPILDVLANAFIISVLCIFMLLQREDLRDRVLRLVSHGHLIVTTQAMDDAASRVSKYLLMQSIINSIYGTCVAIGLLFLGIPNAMLWGLLAALLRFIPYVGPWLGAALPMVLSLALPGHFRPVLTLGLFVGLEIICSSVLEPTIYGSHTGVSSIAILAAAVFWAWEWGGVGLLLATPLTVLLVVLGKYVPQMEFLSILLGDEQVFDPPTRYYQRLLASDPEEAGDLVDEFLGKQTLAQVYETVLLPALGLAQRDRYRGRLDPEKEQFIRDTMKEQVEELAERLPSPPAPSVDTSGAAKSEAEAKANAISSTPAQEIVQPSKVSGAENVQVLCLPARDEADELAGMMFAQVLERSGYKAEAVSVTALASEMMDLVTSKKVDIVVISALPPSAVQHARYLCKRLHQKFPDIRMLIGLWTGQGDLGKAQRRISCTTKDPVVANFSDGLEAIHQMVPPVLLSKGEAEKRVAELANPPLPPVAPGTDAWSAESGGKSETSIAERQPALGVGRTT